MHAVSRTDLSASPLSLITRAVPNATALGQHSARSGAGHRSTVPGDVVSGSDEGGLWMLPNQPCTVAWYDQSAAGNMRPTGRP